MEKEEAVVESHVDLSQLISISVDFKSLQIFLRSVITRLEPVETGVQIHDKKLLDLFNAVDELRLRGQKPNSEKPSDAPELLQLKESLDALTTRVNTLATQKETSALPAEKPIEKSSGEEQGSQPGEVDSRIDSLEKALQELRQQQQKRSAELEKELQELRHQSEQRDAELESKIGSIRAGLANAQRGQPQEAKNNGEKAQQNPNNNEQGADLRAACEQNFNILQGQLDDLRKQLDDQRKMLAQPRSSTPVAVASPSQLIDQDALIALNNAIQNHTEMLRAQKEEIRSLGEENSRIASSLQEKASRNDLAAVQDSVNAVQAKQLELSALASDLNHRLESVSKMMPNIEAKLKTLGKEKAEESDLQRLRDSLASLEKSLQQQLISKPAQSGGAQGSAIEAALIEDLRNQIGQLGESASQNNEWMKGQVIEIRAVIEHIHHSKADASLVANKAEREYVENSMEKLMREVEQVLNATNAGLIDTLDKSLNILRDMIDGKATKADVTKLQTMIGEEQIGTVPEGLTGFKGYRCLGCNRSLEGMRQRPMGGNFSSFMNRLPNNQRPINSSQGVRVPVAPPPSAGYIGAPPGSA